MFITEGNDHAFRNSANIESIETTLRIAQTRFNEWSKLPQDEQTTKIYYLC